MTESNLSFVEYTGDGSTTQFALTIQGEDIGYFSTNDIHGYVDGVEVPILINRQTPHLVNFSEAPAASSKILIRREMPITKTYADFERGSNFGQRQLNNSFLQQLYLTQQILDGFFPESFYLKGDIDVGGHRIINVADAIDESDAVTKRQVEQFTEDLRVTGGSTISASPPPLAIKGQRWTDCKTYISYIYTGNEWVQDVPNIGGLSILTSPNGTKWLLTVSDAGVLSSTEII